MSRNRYDDDDDRPRRRDDDDRGRRDDDFDDRPRRRRRYDEEEDFDRPPPRKSGGVGKVLLIVFSIVGIMVVLLGAGVFYAFTKVRDAAGRAQVSNNGKQLAISLHTYHDVHNSFPGPYVDAVNPGMPAPSRLTDRLSWRIELLPYIEQDNLYRGINRGQAWNSPANTPFTSVALKTFGDPLDPLDANTRFRCFYDNGALFSTKPGERVSVSGVTDGTSNTIMFAESGDRVPWAQFNEWAFDPAGTPPALGHPQRDVFMVGMADGSVRFVKKTVSPTTLRAVITRAGNDHNAIGPDW